ncbi:hypothetical protein B0H16DRAFT_1773435, partial [Mycena metata]
MLFPCFLFMDCCQLSPSSLEALVHCLLTSPLLWPCSHLALVPSGSLWFPLVPSGSLWFPLVPSGSLWFPLVPSGSLWFPLVPSGSLWFPLVPSGSLWFPLVPSGSLWFPLVPSGTPVTFVLRSSVASLDLQSRLRSSRSAIPTTAVRLRVVSCFLDMPSVRSGSLLLA